MVPMANRVGKVLALKTITQQPSNYPFFVIHINNFYLSTTLTMLMAKKYEMASEDNLPIESVY